MKIKLKEQFKEDFRKTRKLIKDKRSFDHFFCRTFFLLQNNQDLSLEFASNKLMARGEGWYDCYIYEDIVMLYKIQGQYVKLSRIGTCENLYKEE